MGALSKFETILNAFGVGKMSWIIRGYLLLFLICVALLIFAVIRTPDNLPANSEYPAQNLFTLASDTLRLILGELMGSPSLAAEWN